jgi:hypothetical protein
MQENKKAKSKDSTTVKQRQHEKSPQPLEPLQDKMLLGGYSHLLSRL